MKKKLMSLIAAVTLAATIFTGCGSSKYADVNAYLADEKVKSQLAMHICMKKESERCVRTADMCMYLHLWHRLQRKRKRLTGQRLLS